MPADDTGATGPGAEADSAAEVEDALVWARPTGTAALVLARARVAASLFGAPAGGALGRFRVLERLGAGGMGVVYAAYDPELDRGVALKVVEVPARGRDAALAEAKALARLAHPNVVPIHDVGIEGAHVYLVMELVRGLVLRAWVKDRDVRAIVGVYRQAGEALAAAHAAGLVHRDFKPDNAIVGRDGRLRVVDFGLACEAAGLDGGGERRPAAGTPRYMAPEQAAGAPVAPAADQYSFCVALAEALAGARDATPAGPPRWLAAVLERGRARDPGARFPSMAELLHALARDPARARRRRLVGGAAAGLLVAVGAVAFAVGRTVPAAAPDRCAGGAGELAAVWSVDAEAAALARVARLGGYGEVLAPRLAGMLRDHRAGWLAGHRDACTAHRRGAQSEALFDRRTACLYRGRAALAEVAAITGAADAATLPELARAARALPDPAACADLDALLAGSPPPPPAIAARVAELRERLARVQVQLAAGRYADARAAATAALADARALDHRPLLAEALEAAGHATMMEDRAAAVPFLVAATDVATRVGDDALAVEAWARRAWAQGTDARADRAGALAGVELIEALAARPSAAGFARALLYNNLGGVELAGDRRAPARAAFERALAVARDVTGPGAVELLAVRSNLALVTDDPARRDRLFTEAIAELARLLGAEHPDTLRIGAMRATTAIVPLPEAAATLTPICEAYGLHAGLGPLEGQCWSEVGYLRAELGEAGAAVAAIDRAGRDPATARTELPGAHAALWRGDAREAVRRFRAAQAGHPPPPPHESWWQRAGRAEFELGLGRALRAAGDLDAARRSLAASEATLAEVSAAHPAVALERRLGRARAELALTLAALGAPRAQVAPLAAAAAAWLRRAGGRADEVAALERLATAP